MSHRPFILIAAVTACLAFPPAASAQWGSAPEPTDPAAPAETGAPGAPAPAPVPWITGDDLTPGGALAPGGPSAPVVPGRGPTVRGSQTALAAGGVAYAPSRAPLRVRQAVWAANRLRNRPYRWGGGHLRWSDSGYDCSGAVSYVLHAAGLLGTPLDSRALMRWGRRGSGRWISVYANRGHVFMVIAGLRFDTSGAGERGPRWRPFGRSASRFAVRHPAGL